MLLQYICIELVYSRSRFVPSCCIILLLEATCFLDQSISLNRGSLTILNQRKLLLWLAISRILLGAVIYSF
jgi:hypothetical protein